MLDFSILLFLQEKKKRYLVLLLSDKSIVKDTLDLLMIRASHTFNVPGSRQEARAE